MTLLREDVVHYYMRQGVRADGWTLVAGQYPNGSDDELRALYVVNPSVARDRSPMPRHHSLDKLVPDLVAVRGDEVLVVEAKPGYDGADELKLAHLLTERRSDFDAALDPMLIEKGLKVDASDLRGVPALALSRGVAYPVREGFAYLEIGVDGQMNYVPPIGELS